MVDSTHREGKPARNIFHPWEELDKVSSWASGMSDTLDVVINKLNGVILPGFYSRFIVNNSQNCRRSGTANMVIPFRGVFKSIRSEDEGLFYLCSMEYLNDTLVESLMCSPAHPTPANDKSCYEARA